jgi:cytochrome c2
MSRRASLPLLVGIFVLGISGCEADRSPGSVVENGDPQRGRREIVRLQCGACHAIPGVRAARGRVGPPLEGFGNRIYLAGKWPNEPHHLVTWLRDPPRMAPLTAMPALVDDEQSARDIAAYLYTLE